MTGHSRYLGNENLNKKKRERFLSKTPAWSLPILITSSVPLYLSKLVASGEIYANFLFLAQRGADPYGKQQEAKASPAEIWA